MSKGGGGGGSTTTVQKADPWSGLQPYLNKLYGGAGANFDTGGPKYYPGNTTAPSNWNLEHALDLGYKTAAWNVDSTNQAAEGLHRTANGVGMGENPAYRTLQPFASGDVVGSNPGKGMLSNFGGGSYVGSNPSSNYFESAMSGQFLNGNPYTEQMVQAAQRPVVSNFQNAIAPALASQFSLAGRTGSGAHVNAFGSAADSLGRTLADQSAGIYGNAYNMERGLQQAAAGQVSQQDQFERGQQLQGAQSTAGLYANERDQQLRASEDITGAYNSNQARQMQAQLAMPQMLQSNFGNLDKMLGIGQFQQGQQQTLIDADKSRFDFNQQRPTMNLQLLNQLLQGGMSLNGSTSSGKTGMDRNPFNSALGGAATSYGLGSMFGGEAGAAMMGVPGLIGGALLGGLFG